MMEIDISKKSDKKRKTLSKIERVKFNKIKKLIESLPYFTLSGDDGETTESDNEIIKKQKRNDNKKNKLYDCKFCNMKNCYTRYGDKTCLCPEHAKNKEKYHENIKKEKKERGNK